ncbi:FAD binding domain-containing protein [Colletotrichum musicola]|uniref:FAD binding domain-containing protein n=1 Tax=Colletotrichum musicola TaxID=2175873 RepID=A0A8H6N9P5_9PEZI|nr:FAD binding domain-containing protein [Colletotrichum musicola]
MVALAAVNLTLLFSSHLSPDARIILRDDQQWNTAVQQRWSVFSPPTYLGAIKPATEQDVAAIVKIASANDIPFLATGAGHGASLTTGNLHDGIDIDLGNFNGVQVDAANSQVTVGGSTTFEQLYEPLYAAGKEIPTASGPCVGVVGATLGGGVTRMQGIHGMLVDSLLSVRVVTATGGLVTASETENPDLFWGLRGAGSNFGIVTSATYKVYDLTNNGQVFNADFVFAPGQNESVFEAVASYNHVMPPNLAIVQGVAFNPTLGVPTISINAVFYGPEDQARAAIAPFLAIPNIRSNISVVPWNVLPSVSSFGTEHNTCTKDNRLDFYGLGLRAVDAGTFGTVFDQLGGLYAQQLGVNPVWSVQRFSNAGSLLTADEKTAYPHRDLQAHMFIISIIHDAALDSTIASFVENARAELDATSGNKELSVYVNYAHGDEGAAAWYSRRKLPQLKQLKKKWDAKGLFSFTNPVPAS